MPELSLVIPYYKNPRMLRRQMLTWRHEWTNEAKARVEIVIVDDGSPDETASEVLGGDRSGLPALSLYRVLEDRLWHQHGARNLGAHVAAARWLLMTDMDHVVPDSTVCEVLRLVPSLGPRDVLTFGRVDAPRWLVWLAGQWPDFEPTRRADGGLKPHVNSFVADRQHYWKIGGYDEDYCGIYGTDIEFRRRLFGSSLTLHLDYAPLIRVDRAVIDDASTRGVERKTAGRTGLKRTIAARKLLEGRADRTTTLNFPWERVF